MHSAHTDTHNTIINQKAIITINQRCEAEVGAGAGGAEII